ncbi:NAD(P)/FAD-dependent oxidoreductase [Arcticibacterium luteifluviistationis]|uniref:FAD-dependent oxidoreductase n=1 Tax=Arcticibacterium luteifluviistationis TaxID=1784714 RepID=A0A2Z4G6Y6_9BACT|nr:NAD(P)/FAD-dependent oxidoreductase [Arcticibacterium luteifluviistationis]AWV96926.1 FAD-dependent oxidoreductase [Arcticibacterium luteifluviistationis]
MHIAIIGNGISGITAARHIRKLSDHKISVISSETEHFYSRTALMYIYMGHMKYEHTKGYEDWFWEKNRIDLVFNHVSSIDFKSKKLTFSNDSESLTYDKLIIATGSAPNKFGWPGQDLNGVQGLYSMQDLEKLEELSPKIEHAVIVGGGLIGLELAEMLKSRNKEVTMLVRESSFWNGVLPAAESEMLNEHIKEHHIDLRLNAELSEIKDDGAGNASAVVLKSEETLDCQLVGLTVGVHANVSFLKETDLEIDRGILVNEYLETNIKDVYSIGDCCQHRNPPVGRRPTEQIWYTGKIMGETLAKTICSEPTKYEPGVFYNSAKFLDIEYQTYGTVLAKPEDNVESFYWKHPEKHILVRLNFDKSSKTIIGVNTFGIRMRHEVWDKWLSNNTSVEDILIDLPKANFDPEFFATYEQDIISHYNATYGTDLKQKSPKKSFFSKLFN